MIEKAVSNWHAVFRGEMDPLEIVADDCISYSPAMFKPKHGRQAAAEILEAAHRAFAQLPAEGQEPEPGSFEVIRTVVDGQSAMLEFEFTMDGIYVNGVDIITANDEGLLTELKIMVRPKQGLDLAVELMGEELRKPRYEISEVGLEKKTAKVRGLEMAYAEAGEGDPIVFLHGNPTSSYLWRNILPTLSGLGRCIAPDLVGMGDSGKLAESGPDSYRFVEHRDYLDELLDQLGVTENVVLVVHDWGSALGFDWAKRHPDAVQGIAYMESIVAPGSLADMPPVFAAFRSPAGEDMVLDKNTFVEKLLPSLIMRELTDAEMNEYRRPFAEAGEGRRPTLTWPREIPLDGEPADVHEIVSAYSGWLGETETPKLFVNADPGAMLTGPARKLCRSWKNQTEVTVPGVHFLQEDSPREIAQAVTEFVSGLRR